MTAADPAVVEALLDDLASIGDVETGPFFGGTALRVDGVQLGFVMGTSTYFAVDDTNRPHYDRHESAPFTYGTNRGMRVVTSYRELPTEIRDDTSALRTWAQAARSAAQRRRTARARPTS